MTVERKGNEILVRLSANLDLETIQEALNFLAYKEAAQGSKASPEDAQKLGEEVNQNIWRKVKKERGL